MMAARANNGGSNAVTPVVEPEDSSEVSIDFCLNQDEDRQMRTMQQIGEDEESTAEYLKTLLGREARAYLPCDDYLRLIQESPATDPKDRVSEAWRRKLCEWCYEVVDHFNFEREVVSIALDYLDRIVAFKVRATPETEAPLPKRQFQLLAVTSLYMALKLHSENDASTSGPRRKLKISAYVELSRGFFQVDAIEAEERTILEALDWHVNPPTCLRFIASLLRLCPKWTPEGYSDTSQHQHAKVVGGIYDVARYLAELTVCVSAFSFQFKNSVTAYAAILCAIEALQTTMPLPYHVRVAFLNTVFEATGLSPESEDVRAARGLVKELCPAMFESDTMPPEYLFEGSSSSLQFEDNSSSSLEDEGEDGKVSPVCVVAATTQDANRFSRRKRLRPSAEEPRTAARRVSNDFY